MSDKYNKKLQLPCSACPDATRSSNGAHPARLYNDVSEETAGWTHQFDILSDIARERF